MQATIIYRNTDYNGGTYYKTVAKVEVSDQDPFPVVLESLFEQFNIGDRAGLRIRSLSVGDVVCLTSGLYRCEPVGWQKLSVYP